MRKKSFNVYFRKAYGCKELNYALFDRASSMDGECIDTYRSFILRNGGNDTEYLKFHDALIQHLARGLAIATQESRPAILYLNGEYMGIYVLQEKYSDRYFADHYDVSRHNVILINERAVDDGEEEDIAFYESLMAFCDRYFTDETVYDEFCGVVDIDFMIDYYAVQIYIGNAGWVPNANMSLWRVRVPENDAYGDGRWRWVLYDTEQSSSLFGKETTAYSYPSFSSAIQKDPLFASVIRNPVFYRRFAEKIRALSTETFAPEAVKTALSVFADAYKPYMANYYKRFGDTSGAWNYNINGIQTFFANRFDSIWSDVRSHRPE